VPPQVAYLGVAGLEVSRQSRNLVREEAPAGVTVVDHRPRSWGTVVHINRICKCVRYAGKTLSRLLRGRPSRFLVSLDPRSLAGEPQRGEQRLGSGLSFGRRH
jgi:hypothetical protein